MKYTCRVVASALIAMSVLLAGCDGSKHADEETSSGPVNLTVEMEDQDDALSEEFAGKLHFRIIPLEANDSSLFKGSDTQVLGVDEDIVLLDELQDKIIRFDKNGKYLGSFSPKGQGPEECSALLRTDVSDGKVYVLDWKKIQVYDKNGKYLSTINGIEGARANFAIVNDSIVYLRKGFQNEYQLEEFDMAGKQLYQSMPSIEKTRTFSIPRGPVRSLSRYKDGVIVANAMDMNIYYVKDTVEKVLATLDFPGLRIPTDFFDGTTGQIENRFHNLRINENEHTSAILFVDNVVGSDNWLVYIPEYFGPVSMVWSDLRTGKSYTNRDLPSPLNVILSEKVIIDGYNPSTDEFYALLSADRMRDLIDEYGIEILDGYPELQKVIDTNLDEDSNDYLLLIKAD